MSDARDMTQGWFVGRHDGTPGGSKVGPYTWDQMVGFAREGRIAPTDMVWHESMPEWAPATSVQGLMPAATSVAPQPTQAPQPAPAPTPQPAPQPAYAPQPAPHVSQGPPSTPPKKTGKVIGLIVLALAVVGALGAGAFFLLGNGDGGGGIGDLIGGNDAPDLGVAEVVLPEPSSLIQTTDWGEVPANQVGITLLDGYERAAAEAVATTLGGSIVGEIEYISMFQIQFDGATEADLVAALDTATSADGVEFAFPNQQTELDIEIWGVRASVYNDPVYAGDAGKGYEAVGVDKAWTYIKGAGVELNPVKVGIVDDGLYREGEGRENEFGGDVKISYPDEESGELANRRNHKDGTPNEAGSHGTGVATIIAADPDNGGPSGIAGPLGDKLEISMLNQYSGKYGLTETQPDPNDPTKVVYDDGKTYSQGGFAAINKQIESGATIINCSWGNVNAHPHVAAAYKKYFENLAADHPNVLFVCSGGNTGTALDGSKRYPSGLALPNMITVGALDNDGTLADYSSKKSDNYEVTLGAPGTDAVVGQDGAAVRQSGTSFAAPHVAAAAAMLRSIDPTLDAGDIKRILVETARPGITVGDTSNLAPPEVGGRVLAIDQAVLKVINDKRATEGKPPLDPDQLAKLGVVDAVAISDTPGEYTVKGIVEAVGDGGTSLSISVSGGNHAIGGSTSQSLEGPGETIWDLTLPEDEGVVTVTRSDSGASSVISIEAFDINGLWSGTFTITDIQVQDEQAAEDDGCSLAILDELIGTPFPATMDISVNEAGSGSAVFQINAGEDSEPQNLSVRSSGSSITFEGMEDTGPITMTVGRQDGGLAMSGGLAGGGDGWTYTASLSLTKPE